MDKKDKKLMTNLPKEQPIDLKRKLFRFNTLIGFILSAIIIYVFTTRFDFGHTLTIISNANILLMLAAFLVFYGFIPIRGHRWQKLLMESNISIPVIELSRVYFIAWFANSILPARIGDLYRAYLLKKNNNLSFSLSLGVLFSERIFDLIAIASLVVLGGILYMNRIVSAEIKNSLIIVLIVVFVIAIVFTIFSWRADWLNRFLPEKIKKHYNSFRQGLFRSPRKVPFILSESLLIWLSESARLYFVAWALGYQFDFLLAVFISQAALIIMSLPLTPAGLGLVELLMFGVLIPAGYSQEAAAAIVIADRLISYWLLIILGATHYMFSPRYR